MTPLVCASAVLFLPARWGGRIALLPPVIVLALVLPQWWKAAAGVTMLVPITWFPSLGISADLRLDYLGAFFVVIVAGIGLGVVQYSRVYLGPKASPRFWAALLMFMGAMLGIILSDSLLLLFVFWELTTVSSALLIAMDFEHASARTGAIQAFLVTGFGGLCILAGAVLLGQMFGTYNLSALEARATHIVATPVHALPLVLLLIGAFTKSAQFPFHFWLPDVMTASPPVSAYLHSATMVKAGVFLIGRLFPIFDTSPLWRPIIITVGLATFLVAGWDALREWDLKKLLAYSTVANLGVLVALYGLYTHGQHVRGELLNIANHSLYKSALFLLVGWMEKVTGTRDLSILKNEHWIQREPTGGILVGIGALAMGGAPFTLGFMSKEALFEAVIASPAPTAVISAIAIAGGAMALAYGLKLFVSAFWGPQQPPDSRGNSNHENSPWLLIVPAILLLPQLIGGIAPGWFIGTLLEPGTEWPTWLAIWHHLDLVAALSLTTLVLGLSGYLLWRWVLPSPSPPRMRKAAHDAAEAILTISSWITRAAQAGGHARYLTTMLLFAAITSGWFIVTTIDSSSASTTLASDVLPGIAWLPALIVAAGTVLTLFLPGRASKFVAMAVAGYGLALLFIVFRAPDLALTQILVETMALVLLLLALRHLPRLGPDERTYTEHASHGFIAVIVGVGLAALAWSSGIHHVAFPASAEQLARSLSEAKGRNVVNVIIVDFRGADTLGEIAVLAVAATGVVALLMTTRDPSTGGEKS